MSWILLSLCSAVLLGIYDLLKKSAVQGNAVLPVLYFGVLTGAGVWLPLMIWAWLDPSSAPGFARSVTGISVAQHGWLLLKSAIAGASWLTGYFAVKHLPVTIAGPIRATSPLWTLLVAVLVLGEAPGTWQWIGIALILAAFLAFSMVGRLEGIRFHRDKWVLCMIASALLSSASALYDKHLLQRMALPAATVQCWFSLYLGVVFLPVYLLWRNGAWPRNPFHWRWSIPAIGLSLLAADYLYFTALSDPEALLSVVSPVRRASVVVTFLGGILMFGERNWRPKAVCVAILLLGVCLLYAK